MYMIEISEDKLSTMAEHVEQGLRHLGKLMQCLEDLEEDTSDSGAYGDKGTLGMRDSEDWWDEDEKRHKESRRSKELYRDRMRY